MLLPSLSLRPGSRAKATTGMPLPPPISLKMPGRMQKSEPSSPYLSLSSRQLC